MFAVVLLFFVFGIYINWRLFAKTGNSGALSLLMLIPIVNLIMYLWLVFSEWPIEREVKSLRSQQQMGGQRYAPPAGPPYS